MTVLVEKQFEAFLKRARAVHGDKYSYGDPIERDSKGRAKIICHRHGAFWQLRGNHVGGSGCKKCALAAKTTTVKSFIERAQSAHGIGVFDYSQVTQFKSTRDKVSIICFTHGEFFQAARDHMRGVGCHQCAIEASRKSFDDFVIQARNTHGDRYQYLESSWRADPPFIAILCSIHGEFKQREWNHTVGEGCPNCGLKRRTLGFEGFLERAKSVHGSKYDYLEDSYKDTGERISIVCKDHGEFEQFVGNHLNGQGCPRCFGTTSLAERNFADFLESLTNQKIIRSDKSVIHPFELDVYLPDLRVAFEFNGTYWHDKTTWVRDVENRTVTSKEAEKSQTCLAKSITLFHVWEDDWIIDQELWKDILTRIFKHAEGKLDLEFLLREVESLACSGDLNSAALTYSRRKMN